VAQAQAALTSTKRAAAFLPAAVLVPLCAMPVLDASKPDSTKASPEARAVAYLTHEVPRWFRENECYSCHNNGDAARALYVASRRAHPIPAKALVDTSDWLGRPRQWDNNKGDKTFADKGLARIQFAAALVEALDAGALKDREALTQAAALVAGGQTKDGSWQVDAAGNIGTPATYGGCLATTMARRTLERADPTRYRDAIAKADRWLRTFPVATVLDAAAILLALPSPAPRGPGLGDEVVTQRQKCVAVVRKGQSKEGGWGPYVNSPSEPFDTAVVLLALAGRDDIPDGKAMLRRGRAFLLATQRPDGSWDATTRPAGGHSYAQHMSTTGWATLALLATKDE
jgi:hypothetical protein